MKGERKWSGAKSVSSCPLNWTHFSVISRPILSIENDPITLCVTLSSWLVALFYDLTDDILFLLFFFSWLSSDYAVYDLDTGSGLTLTLSMILTLNSNNTHWKLDDDKFIREDYQRVSKTPVNKYDVASWQHNIAGRKNFNQLMEAPKTLNRNAQGINGIAMATFSRVPKFLSVNSASWRQYDTDSMRSWVDIVKLRQSRVCILNIYHRLIIQW